jgi:REP element-mobilizing transposase RayT
MRARQLELVATAEVVRHGGRRNGAGRKPAPGRKRHKHVVRPFHDQSLPVHVVLRVTGEVGRLRRRSAYQAVRWAMIKTAGRTNFRIVHLSIQGEHIHLLCEADDRIALANGIRGFCVSAARRLNVAISKERGETRRGRVFTDRYHATTITHPRQARNALAYVLNNWRKHRDDRGAMRTAQVDPYSTGVWFPSWAERDGVPFVWPKGYEPLPCRAPTTWLLKEGWKRGRAVVSLKEVPGGSEQMLERA